MRSHLVRSAANQCRRGLGCWHDESAAKAEQQAAATAAAAAEEEEAESEAARQNNDDAKAMGSATPWMPFERRVQVSIVGPCHLLESRSARLQDMFYLWTEDGDVLKCE